MKWIPHEEQDEKSWIIIYKQYQFNSEEETLKIKNKFMDDHLISILFCDRTDGSVGWLTDYHAQGGGFEAQPHQHSGS